MVKDSKKNQDVALYLCVPRIFPVDSVDVLFDLGIIHSWFLHFQFRPVHSFGLDFAELTMLDVYIVWCSWAFYPSMFWTQNHPSSQFSSLLLGDVETREQWIQMDGFKNCSSDELALLVVFPSMFSKFDTVMVIY